jgi:hypothetical protein
VPVSCACNTQEQDQTWSISQVDHHQWIGGSKWRHSINLMINTIRSKIAVCIRGNIWYDACSSASQRAVPGARPTGSRQSVSQAARHKDARYASRCHTSGNLLGRSSCQPDTVISWQCRFCDTVSQKLHCAPIYVLPVNGWIELLEPDSFRCNIYSID